MTAVPSQQIHQCNRDDLRALVVGALPAFEADKTVKSSVPREDARQLATIPQRPNMAPIEGNDAATDAAVIGVLARTTESAISDADRLGRYIESVVDHLQSIDCTTEEEVGDYFISARKTLASIYLAVSQARPSPAELTKLALRFALDPRKSIEGDLRRFSLSRTEDGWEVIAYPSLAMKVPAIPLPGRSIKDVFAVQILNLLHHDPPQIFKLMNLIEFRLGCVPSGSDGLDAEALNEDALAEPKIRVDLEKKIVWLYGEPIPVRSDGAYFVDALTKANGNWISLPKNAPTEDHRDMIGYRPDRVRRKLRPELQELIESQGGKGSRLRMT